MSQGPASALLDLARTSKHKLVVNLEAARSSQPRWVRAGDVLPRLFYEDAAALNQVAALISERYPGGTLFVRKIRAEDSDQEKVQLKFMHKSRGCDEEALSLKDAARKLTAALEYVEASRSEEHCQAAFQVITTDPRYAGARLFYKKCDEIDGRRIKAKVEHPIRERSRLGSTLREAMDSLAVHMLYEEVTPENQAGLIWDRLAEIIKVNHLKAKVYFKETKEYGPLGEFETTWRVKVDQPTRSSLFEAKSRILEEAAGQVYDALVQMTSQTDSDSYETAPDDDDEGHILSPTSEETETDFADFVDAVEDVDAEGDNGALEGLAGRAPPTPVASA